MRVEVALLTTSNLKVEPMFVVSSPLAAWSIVVASGLLEVVFSVTMKLSDSYSKALPGGISIVAAVLSVWLMSLTLKILPLGDAYAVWAGIGAAGTALVGIVWFHEPVLLGRLFCIALVVVGIVGLQLQEGI
ncbi:multidrug efflux SMR transporter [Burkholderia sp. Se-20373]|nr:multidrug efflux SMR transporter [Burkholderia sp. Se-20373]MBY4805892.1 multidrug efflux SMR transporter [Burkholderia cepacia]RQT43272.1 QacE family quaternary ammonium compound efflux SMR transporter [Burkholderia cepacia]